MSRKYYVIFKRDNKFSLWIDTIPGQPNRIDVMAFKTIISAYKALSPGNNVIALLTVAGCEPSIVEGIPSEEIQDKWMAPPVRIIAFGFDGPKLKALRLKAEAVGELWAAGEKVNR